MEKIGFLFAIIAAVMWGLAYTLDQKILVHSSPIFLLFFNAVITIAVTLPIVIINGDIKSSFHLSWTTITLILSAQFLALLASFFILSGIKILGASLASIFEIMYPIFVILFSYLLYGDSFSIFFWIGSSFLFIGSFILILFA